MGQSYDSDRPSPRRASSHDGGPGRLPPVAPPPRKIQSSLPEMAVFRGVAGSSAAPQGGFGPLPPVAAPPVPAGRALPPVNPPPALRNGTGRAPPPAPSRDPLADSITRVKGGYVPDTHRDVSQPRFSDQATNPTGGPGLDWDEDEESTHVFHSSAPPPSHEERRASFVPQPAAGMPPQSTRPHEQAPIGYGMAAPPGTDTLRLDALSSPGVAPAYAPQPGSSNLPARQPGQSGLSPMFPPPPPIPSITQARPMEQSVPGIVPATPIDVQEVRDNQPFTRLPTGNPHTATELGIKKPSLPPNYAPPSAYAPAVPAAPMPMERRDPKKWILAAATLAALLSLGALVAFLFTKRPGGLQVEVKDAAGASVPKASVYIDGRKVCEATPCSVRDLQVGRYAVRVMLSDDDALEPLNVDVQAGSITPVTFTYNPQTATIVAATTQPDVRLAVDGVDRGPLPVKLTDLAPGKHQLSFSGKRFKTAEKSIEVKAGDTLDLEVPRLVVTNGVAKVSVKSEGVSISLVRADGAEPPRAYNIAEARPIEVDTAISWKLVAKKKGFPDLVQSLTFADGEPERTITVEFKEDKPAQPEPVASAAPAPVAVSPTLPQPTKAPTPEPKPEPAKPEPVAAQPTGNGFLNINSIPASRVLLDGQPLGETPKSNVSVSAGTHTVTFIHPELGKKSVSVKVGPGETKTASAKLK
jgi:hypothetical protein